MLFIRKGSGLSTYGIVRKDTIDDGAYYMLEPPKGLIRKLKYCGLRLSEGQYVVATCPTTLKNIEESSMTFEAPLGEDFVKLMKRSVSDCIIVNNIADAAVLMACGDYSMKLRDTLKDTDFHIIYNVDLMNSHLLLDETFFQYFDKKSSIFTFAFGNNIVKGDNLDTHIIHNMDVIQWLGASYATLIGVHPAIKFQTMRERYLISEDSLFKLENE